MTINSQIFSVTVELDGTVEVVLTDKSVERIQFDGVINPDVVPCRVGDLETLEALVGADLVTMVVEAVLLHDDAPLATVVNIRPL